MNRFLKSNTPWLGLLVLALIVVFLAYIFRPKDPEYKTSVNESLSLMDDYSKKVSVSDIAGTQLIDIRSASQFEQGHEANAINIPLRQILDKENIAIFEKLYKNGQEVVLYGSDELEATAPWLLLHQLGYKNLKLLKGGYTSLNEFKETAAASKEEPIFDKTALQVRTDLTKAPEIKVVQKNKELIIPVRKASSGGGC